jgi:hypothetical protein
MNGSSIRIRRAVRIQHVLGCLSAIPVGAVQVDVAKKAINGHLLPALAVRRDR